MNSIKSTALEPTRSELSGLSFGQKAARYLPVYGLPILTLLLILLFSLLLPRTFPTLLNLRSIISDKAIIALLSLAAMIPMASGRIDLTVGYGIVLWHILAISLQTAFGVPWPIAVLIVILLGVVTGFINGLLVEVARIDSFIATLGTGTIVVGLNYAYSGGIPLQLTQSREFTRIAIGRIAGVPHLVIIMAVVLILLWVILNRTVQGQHIKAIGVSPESARRAGVAVDRSRIVAFAIASTCAAIGGVLMASNLGSGQVTAGDSFMLTSFSAAFLGSAALREGQFHILGTLIGVLTVAVGNNGLAMIGAPIFTQFLFTGTLLVVAVALGGIGRRFARG